MTGISAADDFSAATTSDVRQGLTRRLLRSTRLPYPELRGTVDAAMGLITPILEDKNRTIDRLRAIADAAQRACRRRRQDPLSPAEQAAAKSSPNAACEEPGPGCIHWERCACRYINPVLSRRFGPDR